MLGKQAVVLLSVWACFASAEILPAIQPVNAPPVGAPEISPSPDNKPARNSDCRWNECLWQPYALDATRADRKGLSGGCFARAKAIGELDFTRFASSLPETHDWVITQPGPLVDEALRLREANPCPSWASGLEALTKWDDILASTCGNFARSAPSNETLSPCLSALMLFRSSVVALLSGDEVLESIPDSQTIEHLFHAELYSGSPRATRLAALLERFLTILPGDVSALTRLTSVHFAVWETRPDAANKANVARAVSRLELYTLALEDLFPAQVMRALAEGSSLNLRRWALRIAEKQSGIDVANYFLAWSSWMERDRKQAQSYLRQILSNNDESWDLEARIGLKRLLARDPEMAKRTPFFPPGVQLRLTFAVPDAGFAKGAKPWTPGEPLRMLGPESVTLFNNEARTSSRFPEIREAIAEIQSEARTVHTELEDFLYRSALAAIRADHPTVAAAALRDLRAINPEHAGGSNLGEAMELQGRLKQNPQDMNAAMRLGQLWYGEKQYDMAAEQMRKLLVLRPNNTRAQRNLVHFQDVRNWEERLSTEVKTNPHSEKSWYRYACFLAREQRWEEAQAALDRVAAIEPNFARAEALRRKIQLWVQIDDRNQRNSDIYAFLSAELQDPTLAFPRGLAAEILRR